MEHEGDSDTNCDCWAWGNLQKSDKGTGRLGNKRISGDHPDDTIIKIGQITEKSPGDMSRLAVAQTLMLVWKTVKGVNDNIFLARWSVRRKLGHICDRRLENYQPLGLV